MFGGTKSINYTLTAGETYVRDKDDEPKASIFTFAYTKNGVDDDEVRPVTFLWNGGPGSASTLLHMGIYGPKRISVPLQHIPEHHLIQFSLHRRPF